MNSITLMAKASKEACRLLEKEFSFHNPFTVVIEDQDIPFTLRDKFYSLVEGELTMKGEKITRDGQFFKIDKYQKK